MRSIITNGDHLFGPWIAERTNGEYIPRVARYIGLIDIKAAKILAVAMYAACNEASVYMHIAGEKGWLTREYLWFILHYPFEQLQVRKIIAPVESSNLVCCLFLEHVGFTKEATLLDASPNGDLILYTLRKEDCKWLHLRGRSGKTQSTQSA